MEVHHPPIRSLILLGGRSTCTGSPKYLLPMSAEVSAIGHQVPLLLHTILLHHMFQVLYGDPLLRTVTLSVRDDTQRDEIKGLIMKYERELPGDLTISYVQDSHTGIGPAAGLLAAWRLDCYAHWLVTGCHYPLITKVTLEELMRHHIRNAKAITQFVDPYGRNEPLLAIWAVSALEELNQVMEENGNTDPTFVINMLSEQDTQIGAESNYLRGVTNLHPLEEQWIFSVDTKDDWVKAQKLLDDKCVAD